MIKKLLITILIIALIGATIILGYNLYKKNQESVIASENAYNQSLYELVYYMDNVKNYLAKARISTSSVQGAETLTNLWREANLAQTYLSMLPMETQELENTQKFLNQVSDYSFSLSRKNIKGEDLTEEDLNNIENLHKYSIEISEVVNQIAFDLNAGNMKWSDIIETEKVDFAQQVSTDFNAASTLEEDLHEYSGLIYDGAYSEHMLTSDKKALTGDKISEEDAIMSLLGKFGLKDSEAELIMENRLYYIPYNKLEKDYKTLADMIPDTTYYNYGFDIHSYYDSQVHNEDTEIRSFQKHDTPEKFMRYLCAKANVIGVSATAMVPTFDNYNISYLADIIGEKFTLVSEDNLQAIKQKEESLAAEYKEKGIEIITSIMRSSDLYSQKPDKTKAVYEMLKK